MNTIIWNEITVEPHISDPHGGRKRSEQKKSDNQMSKKTPVKNNTTLQL